MGSEIIATRNLHTELNRNFASTSMRRMKIYKILSLRKLEGHELGGRAIRHNKLGTLVKSVASSDRSNVSILLLDHLELNNPR